MKKVLLFIVTLVSASMIFAQTATMRVGDVDLTGVSVGGDVIIPVYVDAINDGTVYTMQFFVGFNHSVLTWKGTFANPTTGIINFHPNFPYGTPNGAWSFNDNGTELVTLWDDASNFHQMPTTGVQKWYDMIFTYNGGVVPGGQSDLVWGTSGKDEGGKYVKGTTEMYDQNFSQYALTLVNGKVFLPGIGGPNTWTDATNDHMWLTNGNWSAGHPPTGSEDVDIPYLGKSGPVVIAGSATVGGLLHVFPLAQVNVIAGGDLTTNGTFQNDGIFLIIGDNTGKSGSYINNGPLLGGGTFEFDRNTWHDGGALPFGDWHYISSPMAAGFENWDFLDYFGLTWNAGAGLWTNMGGGAPNCIPAPQVTINGMSSWAINWDPTYTTQGCPGGTVGNVIKMVGPFLALQTGPFGSPAILGPGGGTPPWTFGPGWNMYGNPYASSLAVAGLNYAGFVPGVAMFSPIADNYVYSTPGNVWAAGNIAPTQGFMVQALAPGAFTVGNIDRTNDPLVVWKADVNNLLTLEATGSGYSDKLWVNIDFEGALPGIDYVGDFSKMFAPGLPQIYTVADGQKLAVNALPATPSVPMEFVAGASGTYTIAAIETSEFANVVLEDLANGMETDLLAGSYTFEYSEGAVHNFVIHFTPLGTPELNANNINIWAADHNIYVQAPATTGDIVVYNLMGQEVVKTDIEAGLNVIPMTDVNTYYIVKVIGSDVTETGKVFIK